MRSLLPLNSSTLERALEAATSEDTQVMLRRLYHPDTCPAHILPWLAWAWSVDRWDSQWSEAVKRNAVRSSFYVHRRKGTIGALRRVVGPLGYLIEVLEWWQTEPQGARGTFALTVGVLDEGITEDMYLELERLIDDTKPVSRHLTGLVISLGTHGALAATVALLEGDVIDIYPPMLQDIVVAGSFMAIGREHSIDTLDVYND